MTAEQESQLVRVNIKVSPEVHQFFKERSIKTGVSMSSLMFLALEKSVQESIFMGGGMQELIRIAKQAGLDEVLTDGEKRLSEAILDMERE